VLHVIESYIAIDLLKPILASLKLLSMLDLQGTRIKMLPNEVFDLFNLRYLGLRDTYIESLSEAVGRLQNLEVLDVASSKLTSLPNNVVKLQKLRYMYAHTNVGADDSFESLCTNGGVKVPNGMHHLAGLRALSSIKATPRVFV
jgi:disease resistance protein RPM1